MRQNARFFGLMVLLVLVTLAMLFLQKSNRPAAPSGDLNNVPELGKVPSQDQIENRAPNGK